MTVTSASGDLPEADQQDDARPSGDTPDLALRAPAQDAKERLAELTRGARRSPIKFLFDARTGERATRASVRGQVEVARQLGKLGPGWYVLHSVPLEGRVIDHLVLGPPGVFALSTKNHLHDRVRVKKSVVKVNGRVTSYLRDAQLGPHRASDLLSAACGFPVEVRPVLVFLAGQLSVRSLPAEVAVVGRKKIAGWLMQQPECQPFETTTAIHEHARRAATWS